MEQVTDILKVENMLELGIIFFFSLIGSFAKDYLKMIRFANKDKFNFIEIFLSTCTATITVFTFSSYIKDSITIRGIILCSFVIGLLGFEILNRFSSISGIMNFAKIMFEFYMNINTSGDKKQSSDVIINTQKRTDEIDKKHTK